MIPWRVLRTGPAPAAWNMAVDEALLEARADGDPPVLRLYRWSPAALSLGRFQPAAEVAVPAGCDLVRRVTGGAAIHHREDEVTYAVVAGYDLFGDRDPRAAYRAVHGVIARALLVLGVPLAPRRAAIAPRAVPHGLCYDQATDYDLVAGEKKLVGSAQRRRGRAFLQHGSLPISPDPASVGATSLEELLGRRPDPLEAEAAIVEALRDGLGAIPTDDALRETERNAAERIRRARYARDAWTFER